MNAFIILALLVLSFSALAENDKTSLLKNKTFKSLIKSIHDKNTDNLGNITSSEIAKLTPSETLGIAIGEELILTIQNQKLLIGDVFAYKSKKNAQLGLINTIEVLDFPITVDLDNNSAKGWFIKQENSFELFLPNEIDDIGKAIVNGETFYFSKDTFDIQPDDIYIDADVLASWFGFNFTFDFTNLNIDLTLDDTLPVVAKMQRRSQKAITSINNQAVLPWKESTYKTTSAPLYDVQLFSSLRKNDSTVTGYSIVGTQDLAYLKTDYYLGGTNEDLLNDFRLKFSKELTGNNILGLKYIEFGDITPIRVGVDSTSSSAIGLSFSNRSKNEITNFEQINLNGNIQPGWDIELYRNGVLIDKQTSGEDARYDFNDISLLFGNNNLELVFYGPQGQVEKRIEQVVVDGNALKSGETTYTASVTQQNKTLFDITNNTQADNRILFSGQVNQGITDWLSGYIGQTYSLDNKNEDEEVNDISIGANVSIFNNLLVNTNLSSDRVNNNDRFNISARSYIGNHSLNYAYSRLFSDKTNNEAKDEWSNKLVMAGPLFSIGDADIQYQNEISQREVEDSNKVTSIKNNLSFVTRDYAITNNIQWQRNESQGMSDDIASGSLTLSKYFGKLNTRFSTTYKIEPEIKIDQYYSELNWPISNKLRSNVSLSYSPETDFYSTRLGVSWHNDYFNLASNASYNSDDFWRIGLNINFSFGIDPKSKKIFTSRQRITNSGSLIARVFEDKNANGQFDQGEPAIPGVKVEGLQNFRKGVTDKKGNALLTGMSTNQRSDITIDATTLPDAYMVSGIEGSSISPRKGYLEYLDFPIIIASEVDGIAYIKQKDGREAPASFFGISLIDKNGNIAAQTTTEFDGYYYFGGLLPGKYRVSIDKNDTTRKKVKENENVSINIAQGEIINGSDISFSELEFMEGFVVNAGSFNNLKILKTYWLLIKKRFQNNSNEKVFYIKDSTTNKFYLNLGFYQEEEQATNACNILKNIKINCSTNEYNFGF